MSSSNRDDAANQRVDFSANAKVYDKRHGAVLAGDGLQQLVAAGAIRPGTDLLDIGAGTGRVAVAFAELGCNVFALEPARGMIETLRTKARDLPIRVLAGAGARLPFALERIEVVVIAAGLLRKKSPPSTEPTSGRNPIGSLTSY